MELVRGRTLDEVRKYDLIKLGVAALLMINWLYFGIGKPAPRGAAGSAGASSAADVAAAAPAPVTAAVPVPASPAAPAEAIKPAAVVPAPASVYFEFGKSEMPADARQVLAGWVEYARAEPRAAIDLSGFHDPVGNPSLNAELAKHRAQAVRDYLQGQGIAVDRINLVKPQVTSGGADARQARRVDVSIAAAQRGN